MPGISVIIPVRRDAQPLSALLREISALTPKVAEILVVDAQADPDVAALCVSRGIACVSSPPGRGRQLNAGARQARGEVLWFLHADASLDRRSSAAIAQALAAGANSGYFRFRFSAPRNLMRAVLESCIALRCRFGTVYGDQALFMTRDAWSEAGGFAPEPLFEEVPLVRQLKKQARFVALAIPVGVSPRRWERDGWWRRTLMNRLLSLGYILGVAPVRLNRWYRGD